MNATSRVLLCSVIAVSYFGIYKRQGSPELPTDGLSKIAASMSSEDRDSVAQYYKTFGRAIAKDPEAEPVFATSADVRKAHRAGMLILWKGALGNESGKYPDLRQAIEDHLAENVGLDNKQLSPDEKQDVGESFIELGKAFE